MGQSYVSGRNGTGGVMEVGVMGINQDRMRINESDSINDHIQGTFLLLHLSKLNSHMFIRFSKNVL